MLTGTPLENRLEELYSIVEFFDRACSARPGSSSPSIPVQDQFGAITGYKNLEAVRHTLAPLFLRRRKADVLTELPPRVDNFTRWT